MEQQSNQREEHPGGTPAGPRTTRRQAVAAGAAAGLGLAVAGSAAGGVAKSTRRARVGKAMGGPSGWPGSQRYQYPDNSAPGRAVAAAKALPASQKPAQLVVGLYPGSIGNYTTPYPKGATPPAQLWEELTGIKIKFVPVDAAQAYAKNTRMAATRDGSMNIVQLGMADTGDLAEAGLLRPLGDYVAKHKPDWNEKKWGYLGGQTTTQMFNYYNGKPYAVASDGDYQIFVIRKDLWESPKEKAAFKAKYGYALVPPKTWDQQRDMAEFFHRPDDGLLGATDLRSPAWGWINFVHRYTSTGNPVAYYWDDNMKPLINGAGGVKALNHMIATTKFGSKDALSWVWPEQYQNWGDGGAAMTIAFSNLTKFQKKGGPFDKSGFDVGSKTWAIPMPGWNVGGKLVRHTSLYFNASNGVNKYSPAKYHEASYLFLQWVASGPIYTWLTANPGGYQDPCKVACLTDPLVRSSYTPRTVDVLAMTLPGAAPSITALKGANQYIQALDINLQKALSGQLSPQKALDAVAASWNQTTNKVGRARQIKAWRASKAGWPTMADSAKGRV